MYAGFNIQGKIIHTSASEAVFIFEYGQVLNRGNTGFAKHAMNTSILVFILY